MHYVVSPFAMFSSVAPPALTVDLECLSIGDSSQLFRNRSQQQRSDAIANFSNGTYEVLVASDIAARGLNMPNVRHVVVFDIYGPDTTMIHRVGRTGRNGNEGHAVIFFDPDEDSNAARAAELVKVR